MDLSKNKLALPDIAALLALEVRIVETYNRDTLVLLPAIRERLFDLVDLVKRGNDRLREQVVGCLVALNIDLGALQAELPAALDEDELVRMRASLRLGMEPAKRGIEEVRSYRNPDLSSLKQVEQRQMDTAQESARQIEKDVAAIEARLAELDTIMDTLEKPSVRKVLKGFIPEDEDIDTALATFKDPTLSPELVKAAIRKLNQHLQLLEQGREYASVIAARQRIASSLEPTRDSLEQVQRQVQEAEEKIAQYGRAERLFELRDQWLVHITPFIGSWNTVEKDLADASDSTALLSALQRARDYLLAVRRCFEAA